MGERVQLLELIERVRVEASFSTNAAHGVQQRPHIIGLLNRVQRGLAASTDWDELDTHAVVSLQAGKWIYDIPNAMNFEKMRLLYARDGDEFFEVEKGFGPREFAAYDPTQDERSWPVQRWRLNSDSHKSFDVWPMPDRAAKLDVLGQKIPAALVNDDDFSTLDGDVLALRVAAHLLAKSSPQEARIKLDDAERRLISLRSDQSSNKGQNVVLGGGLRRQFVNPGLR